MKLKIDYVTNSSSVSFCAWGITIRDIVNIPEHIMRKIYNKCVEYFVDPVTYEDFIDNPNEYDWFEYFYDIIHDTNLDTISRSYYDTEVYIGIKPTNKNVQDMTINEIKKLSLKELIELGFSVNDVKFIEECWRDG